MAEIQEKLIQAPDAKASFLSTLTARFPILQKKRGVALVVGVPLVLLCGLAGLAALPGRSSGGSGGGATADPEGVIEDDRQFYGQSPPVYPSPEMTGMGDWAIAFNHAREMVSNMTLEEKVSLTSGVGSDNGCIGSIPAVERLGFPGLCMGDAGQGLRATDFVSSFPSGIHAGASWNKDLTYQRGAALASEFKKKGVNVLLGPVVGPMGRVVSGGRNWEGFSVDPYLAGALVSESVRGMQDQNVMTSTKHFIANEQETNRNPVDGKESVSSNIDDRTMHEFYLWPFQDAVKAGTANIMCSYQRINNSYGCANSKTLNGLLKTELGFQGFVISDWVAQHAGVATALAGMDMAMPNDGGLWGDKLTEAVENGTVPEARVTDMAVRIISSWYQLKQDNGDIFPEPGSGMPKHLDRPHKFVDARDSAARDILVDGAAEGHVLVKNIDDTLPLRSPRLLSIYGYSARAPDLLAPLSGDGDLGVEAWTFGAQAVDPSEIHDGFAGGTDLDISSIADGGTLIHGGGSGATTPALFTAPFEALKARAASDATALFYDFRSARPLVDSASDACLVFGNAWASESYDRPALRDDRTDALIIAVADQCRHTIVVLHNAGPRLVDRIVDHPNVTAILFAHLPGQESGPALVSLLYGDTNPSGKLPYTVARNESDYGDDLLRPALPEAQYVNFPQSDFDEGVYIDYRRFDRDDVDPRYEFGFGLSYTTFALSNLSAELLSGANLDRWPTGAVITGGQADLWDRVAVVSATLANTGPVNGAEVAQLYVGIPNAPIRQLRGFEKSFLAPNASITVSFPLTRRDLSIWNTDAQRWELQEGEYGIFVGNSSRQLPLEGSLTI